MQEPAAGPARPRAARLYLLVASVVVLTVAAVLVQAVPLGKVLNDWSGRLYSPVRTLVELAFIAWLLSRTGQSWRDFGVRRPASWPRAISLGLAGSVAIFLIDQLIVRPALRYSGVAGGDIGGLRVIEGNWLEYLYWAGPMTLFVAAIGEEFIGRAYLINRVAALTGGEGRAAWTVAVLVSAAVFGLAHAYQGIGGMIGTGVVGACFGVLYLLARRNIWPAVIAHAATDLFGFTAIFAGLADTGAG